MLEPESQLFFDFGFRIQATGPIYVGGRAPQLSPHFKNG